MLPGSHEPWGGDSVAIDFAGGPYLVSGLNQTQASKLRAHFAEACQNPEEIRGAASEILVYRSHRGFFRETLQRPWVLDFDLDHYPGFVRIVGNRFAGRIDLTPSLSGHLWTSDPGGKEFPCNLFENFFRALVAYRLLETGGMLVHSACVAVGNTGLLFPGRSGDGKSTLSRLALDGGYPVLSDDMNALSWSNDKAVVEKVPFAGDLGRSWCRGSSYALGGIYALRKAQATHLEPMSAPDAVALLLACSPFLNADRYRLALLMDSLYRLTRFIPTNTLSFTPDEKVWPLIRSTMPNAGETA